MFGEVEECRRSHTDVRKVNWSYLSESNLVTSIQTSMNILFVQAVKLLESFVCSQTFSKLRVQCVYCSIIGKRKTKQNWTQPKCLPTKDTVT